MSAPLPRCPRCSAVLTAGTAGGMTLHACGACGGAFLGVACTRRLYEAVPPEALHLAASTASAARAAPDLARPARCPVCGDPMGRTRAAATGVDLDTCQPHGTWFDRGEIQRVVDGLRRAGWAARGPVGGGGAMARRAAAGAAIGTGAVAAGAIVMSRPPDSDRALQALDAGVTALDVADVAGGAVEVAGEAAGGAGEVLEGAFALLGVLFEW